MSLKFFGRSGKIMSLDNYLTAEHLPQDGPHRADRPMICLDCGHQFNQPQEMSYGSFFPTGKEECPECRSNQIAPENNFRMTKLERKKYLQLVEKEKQNELQI